MTGQAVIGALRADLILNTAQLGTSANEAMRTFDRLKGRMDGLSGAADKSGRAFNGSLKSGVGSAKASFSAINSEMEKLRARFDPLSVATQKYEQELRDLKTAQVALGLSSEQVAAQQKRLAANFEFNKQAINGFGAAAQQAGFHSTNLFFQLQDISTMMASGQSPFVLAMQQGPQVVGIFEQIKAGGGSMGASLLGAFRSLVSPMSLLTVGAIAGGAALFYWATGADDAGGEAKKAKDPVDALNAAFDRHKASAETATTAISELRKQYGEYAQAVRQGAAEQAERDVFAALKDARPVIAGITAAGLEIVALSGRIDFMRERLVSAQEQASLGLIGPDVAMQTQEAIDALQDNLEGLTSGLGVTSDQAVRFSVLMSNVDAAVKSENMEAMAAAASEALAYIDSLPGGMALATGAFGDAAGTLRDLRDRLAESVTLTARLDAAAPGAGWMGAAIGETNLLIGRLKVAYAQSWALKGQAQFDRNNDVYSGRGGDPRQFMDGNPKAFVSTPEIDKMADKLLGLGGAAGSSGGGSSKLSNAQKAIEKTADEVKKLNEAFEAGETPIAKFRAELKKLDELKLKGLSDGAYAAGVAKLTQELGKSSIIGKLLGGGGLGSIWDDFKTQGKDAWSGLLTDAFSKGGGGFKAISSGLSTAFKSVGSMFTGGGMMAGLAGAMPIVGAVMGGLNLLKGLIGGTTDTDTGFKGQITNGGLDLQKYTDKHWSGFFGLMNNRWTETAAASASITGPLSAASNKIQGEVIKMADRLGFGADSFKNFTYKIDVSLKGLSEDQALEKLKSALSGMGDAFASVVPSIESMQELSSAFNERLSIDRQILQLKGDEAALRQMDIEATHDLNKARLAELHALQDTAKAADEAANAADEMAAAVAKLSPEMFATALDFARAQNRAAVGLRVVGGTDLTPTQAESVAQNGFGLIAGSSLQMTMVKLLNVLQSVQSEGGDSLRVEAV